MSQDIYLHGSEDVRRASNNMQGAAEEMSRAASAIEDSLQRHRMFLEEFISRFEAAADKMAARETS